MPSHAFEHWRKTRTAKLDEIEQAHAVLGGTGPGRRFATEQINHAYAVLLSSQFQGFCRDLHTECAAQLTASINGPVRNVILTEFAFGRKLDQGNPNAGNIGSDFGRLLADKFWPIIQIRDTRTLQRRRRLEELCLWRNAIAHQDFTNVGNRTVHLGMVRVWRRACDGLARTFDAGMYSKLTSLTGVNPW